ncbi:hypothetical protein VNI00_011358 [Paramarasmius palmivorus]|uniref:Sacsin/Nov domain-containing protein n=1 Tax=Paramarasmius palmivorus TaxID=297713 RepID=A0AAW0CDQ3_9AGAR
MAFGEVFKTTDNIKAILDAYPFSVGIFREILQNSDDARATKQIFLLDRRQHPNEKIYHPSLAGTQGPALLAYNDKELSESDWNALQTVHSSSKKHDSSKIGKYGIGFRSCYHVTDNPQVMSGSDMAVFDPHRRLTAGGCRFSMRQHKYDYAHHIDSFGALLPMEFPQYLSGTIFRLPLRTRSDSEISSKIIHADDVLDLLEAFWEEELDIVLLFLRNILTIEIIVIEENGQQTSRAKCSISRTPLSPSRYSLNPDIYSFNTCQVTTVTSAGESQLSWVILHTAHDSEGAEAHLSVTSKADVAAALRDHKLSPEMALAIPVPLSVGHRNVGRLFTFLPLPLSTGFPVHVHGLFSLTQSRQNLRNNGEVGIAEGSSDSVLIKWNEMMFNVFLPKVWAVLLYTISQDIQSSSIDIFLAWPQPQPAVESGDSTNWKDILGKLSTEVVEQEYPIWPCEDANGAVTFLTLTDVLLAPRDSEHPCHRILSILTSAGVKVSKVPAYIIDLFQERGQGDILVSPTRLSRFFQEYPAMLENVPYDDRLSLLDYILSTKELRLLNNLSIVPLPNREFAKLSLRTKMKARATNRILLDAPESNLFQRFDEGAVLLSCLPHKIAKLLKKDGPSILNVKLIDNDSVLRYLESFPSPLALDERASWLKNFWLWLSKDWSDRASLIGTIGDLCLLPSQLGERTVSGGVFYDDTTRMTRQKHVSTLVAILGKLRVPLLPSDFPEEARDYLSRQAVVKSIRNISALLEVMDTKANLSNEEAEAILNHFLKYRTSLTDADRQLARRMPIFPLLSYIADKVQVVLGRIPDRARVEGIEDVTAVVEHSLLPCISDYTFVDSSSPNRDALQILIPSQRPLSSIDLLNLSLKGFGTQPVSFQCRTLKFVAQKVTQIPPSIIETLKATPFLPASNGDLRAPQDVVDPSSAIAKLFSTDTEKLPSAATDAELVMIIGRLGLFQNELTTPLVNERIRYITSSSSKESHKLAQTLLELLETSHFDCANVEVPTGKRKGWLPTKEGLKPHDECLDPKFYQRALFDEVLAMVNGVSLSLRRRFGWGDHVRISVVVQQFKRVVETENKEKLKIVIKELAERLDELDARQIEELRRTIEGRAWIPTTRGIFPSSRVVFSIPNGRDIPGFHRLADAPDSPRGIFYLKMGCTKSPSTHAILSRLNEIRNQASSKRTSEEALLLLQALPLPLPDTDVEDLLIPDAKNMLRPVKEIVYSDVKNGSGSLAGRHLTHPSIDHNLAKNLGISFLGHERLHIENLAVSDFEEKLTTKISSTLTQYTLKQLLPELLANAIDAGAKNFGILVDEQPAPTERLLSPTMERFQICPSLIIHNDGVFSDMDWKGICNIGVGGKLNKTDTIGQYGLGALSMFHLTDMPMVVSGNKVLFLDPSKTHLPSKTPTAAYLLSLPELAREYPDHLSVLDEIFEFDVETEYYDATLFRLPLRRAQDGDSFISNKPLNTTQLLDDLVVPFRKRAQESLLFTPITSITAFHRPTGEGNLTRALWRVDVSRQIRSEEGDYTSQRLEMRSSAEKEKEYRQTWHIVRGENLSPLPPECESLPVTHRIRSPFIVGAAAQLPSGSKKGRKPTAVIAPEVSTLFSTLPLPLGTYLPFELSAPFILSSDRRNIRFESSYEKIETAYNRWLLLEHIPPLYFFLLEELLQDGYDISPCWPGRTAKHDPISETVIKSFYEKLPSTTRRLFMAGTMHLTPGEITSSGNEPPVVFQILTQLGTPNMVQLSPSLSKRFEGAVKQVDQGLLRNEILRNHDGFISWYRKAKKRTEKINILITFLSKGDSSVDILNGLPLLPLADGGLFAFQNGPNSTVIYSSYKQKLLKLLPVTRLVDPKFRSLAPTLHDKGLNIAPLKPEAVKELLQGIIPEGPLRRVSQQDHEQIGRFWELSSHLPEPLEDTFLQLSSLCLLPTSAPLVYISLSHSKEPSVLFTARGDEDWLLPCLTAFRATVVHWTNLERIPVAVLKRKKTLSLDSCPIFLQRVYAVSHKSLASWMMKRRKNSPGGVVNDCKHAILKPKKTLCESYHPFPSGKCIDQTNSGALLKFIRKHLSHPVTPYSFELREMGIQPMSLRAIQD